MGRTPAEEAAVNREWWRTATKQDKLDLLQRDLLKCRCHCAFKYTQEELNNPGKVRCNSCGPIRASIRLVLAE